MTAEAWTEQQIADGLNQVPASAPIAHGVRLWTDERVARLKALWEAGKSCSKIAALLGNGFTRNAVIGKVHRLKMQGRSVGNRHRGGRPRQYAARGEPKAKRAQGPSAPRLPAVRHDVPSLPTMQPNPILLPIRQPIPEPQGELVGLMQLSDKTCKWPIGDPGRPGFGFCGHRPKEVGPYCAAHAREAYQTLGTYRRAPSAGAGAT